MPNQSSNALSIVLLKDRKFNPFTTIETILIELDYMYNYDLLDESDSPFFHKPFGSAIYYRTFLNKFCDLAKLYYGEDRIEQMIEDTFAYPYGYK